jgi:hypothetical protein
MCSLFLARDDARLLNLTGPGRNGGKALASVCGPLPAVQEDRSRRRVLGALGLPCVIPSSFLEETARVLVRQGTGPRPSTSPTSSSFSCSTTSSWSWKAAQPLAELLSALPAAPAAGHQPSKPLRLIGEAGVFWLPKCRFVHGRKPSGFFFLARARAVRPDFVAEDAVADDLPPPRDLSRLRSSSRPRRVKGALDMQPRSSSGSKQRPRAC